MDAQNVSDTLLGTVQKWDLDLTSLVAQGYAGAAVISSNKNGVRSMITEDCRSHVLNLAIASGCRNVPSIRNLFDPVETLSWCLFDSAKRKHSTLFHPGSLLKIK